MKRALTRVQKPKAGPFDGYRRREVPPPDPELTQVGPKTPCGEYLRRFWQPVAFARDLTAAPLRVRILGEDLVVFRDRGGRVGVLHHYPAAGGGGGGEPACGMSGAAGAAGGGGAAMYAWYGTQTQ